MKKLILMAALVAVAAPSAPVIAQSSAQRQYQREMRQYEREVAQYERQQRRANRQATRNTRQYREYDYNRYPPGQSTYYADQYYRPSTQARRLSANERIYRGQDGKYYCRKSDGTTGLIIGGIAGAVLGSVIAPGNSNTLGALLGGAGGALAGRAIDRNNVRCR
jgi:Ni/Co efflux regulator RcnB